MTWFTAPKPRTTSLRTSWQPVKALSLAQHLVALLLLALLSLRLCANLRFLRAARQMAEKYATQTPRPRPRISVLVPARNEAATIRACVTSLLRQSYPDVEILVLDDASTDGTGEQLDSLKALYPRLTILHSTDEPPPGWTGKCYACARLAERATGEWLLFTDADTLHADHSLESGLACAHALDASLLSAFPSQRTITWSERLLISFVLDFLPLVAVSLKGIWRSGSRGKKTQVVANGQYLLVRADAYRAVGGHASIRANLIDDFSLARRLRDSGHTIAIADGTSLLSCRMYSSVAQVWQGLSKNLLGALTERATSPRRPPASPVINRLGSWRRLLAGAAFAWGYACLFVLPVVNLRRGRWRALGGIEIGWLLLLRAVVVWRLRRPFDEIVTTPLASWSVMAIGISALFKRSRRRQVAWKGRLY